MNSENENKNLTDQEISNILKKAFKAVKYPDPVAIYKRVFEKLHGENAENGQ